MWWAQVYVGLTGCQTQYSWFHLHVESKYMWVWQATRPITFGHDIFPVSSGYETDDHYKSHVGSRDFVYSYSF